MAPFVYVVMVLMPANELIEIVIDCCNFEEDASSISTHIIENQPYKVYSFNVVGREDLAGRIAVQYNTQADTKIYFLAHLFEQLTLYFLVFEDKDHILYKQITADEDLFSGHHFAIVRAWKSHV